MEQQGKRQSAILKIIYFFLYIAFGFYLPFQGIFYKYVLVNSDGTPAIELIGLLFLIMPLIGLVGSMSAGILADTLHLGRYIITFCCLIGSLVAIGIGLIGEQWALSVGLPIKFMLIFILLALFYLLLQPVIPIIDAETMLFLNRHADRADYGRYRLWGTFGWSVATIAMGVLLFYHYHLPLILYGTAFGYGMLGIISLKGIKDAPISKPVKIPWGHLKKDTLFLVFLVFVLGHGAINSATFMYMGYFFDDVMKNPFEIGLIFGTWTLLEVPVMIYSPALVHRFGSRWLIAAGLLINAVRLLLFSTFTPETTFLFKFGAALLHGPAFGMTYIGIIDLVDRQAHAQMRATYMSIMNVARISIAGSIGGLAGSWIIKQWSSGQLMQFSGFALFGLVLFFLLVVKGYGPQKKDLET